ncbi:MAG: hypothetical protein Satyrvirus16_5 [Satyrvirus sp.]|uniref:Uncharacterized protein n=1 Tax=Satyrvirus sp. TaxID=2487771 RepID=A0A3G5AJ26_9VIRU|nr:MAG: hypothetical protein Satyrvirus16_5 [Satyrvirus sp.]
MKFDDYQRKLEFSGEIFDYSCKEKFIDFITKNKPIYASQDNRDRIEFIDYQLISGFVHYVTVRHVGWRCPSGYSDRIRDQGSSQLYEKFIFHDELDHCWKNETGIILIFESDDYGMETYLVVKIINLNIIEVLYDRYFCANNGTKMFLVIDPSQFQLQQSEIFDFGCRTKFIGFVTKENPVYTSPNNKLRLKFIDADMDNANILCERWEKLEDDINGGEFCDEYNYFCPASGNIKQKGLIIYFKNIELVVKIINYNMIDIVCDEYGKYRGIRLVLV